MDLDRIIQKRLVELVAKADAISNTRTSVDFRGKTIYSVARSEVVGWSTSVLSLLQREVVRRI